MAKYEYRRRVLDAGFSVTYAKMDAETIKEIHRFQFSANWRPTAATRLCCKKPMVYRPYDRSWYCPVCHKTVARETTPAGTWNEHGLFVGNLDATVSYERLDRETP